MVGHDRQAIDPAELWLSYWWFWHWWWSRTQGTAPRLSAGALPPQLLYRNAVYHHNIGICIHLCRSRSLLPYQNHVSWLMSCVTTRVQSGVNHTGLRCGGFRATVIGSSHTNSAIGEISLVWLLANVFVVVWRDRASSGVLRASTWFLSRAINIQ